MPGKDFVDVRLTEAGAKLAGEHTLRISGGRRTFALKSGEVIHVERSYEWRELLSKRHTPAGEPLCELVPAGTPNAVPAPAPISIATSQETP